LLLGFIQTAAESAVPDWLQVTETVVNVFQALVTGAAVLGGAIWGYFKFVKGRTFSRRIEPAVAGEVTRRGGVVSVITTVTAKNIGASKIDIEPRYCALRVLAYRSGGEVGLGPVSWTRLATLPVLAPHVLLEPGEPIGEQVLFEVPDHQYVAFKLEFYVGSTAREMWLAIDVVNVPMKKDNQGGKRSLIAELIEGIQR
jgi:hypothetical protein